MANLMEGLMDQLDRCRKLLELYKTIPTGGFGAMVIQESIDVGTEAVKSGDVIKMLQAYERLKGHE